MDFPFWPSYRVVSEIDNVHFLAGDPPSLSVPGVVPGILCPRPRKISPPPFWWMAQNFSKSYGLYFVIFPSYFPYIPSYFPYIPSYFLHIYIIIHAVFKSIFLCIGLLIYNNYDIQDIRIVITLFQLDF